MKKICVLGTCAGADAVRLAGSPEWGVVKSFISFSLSSILHMYGKEHKRIERNPFAETKYNNEQLFYELNGDLLSLIKANKFDLLLVDLCDFRLSERVIEFENGQTVSHTQRAYSEESVNNINDVLAETYGSNIKSITVRRIFDHSQEDIASAIIKFIDILIAEFGSEKVMFFCSHPIMQYLDGATVKRITNYKSNGITVRRIKDAMPIVCNEREVLVYPDRLIGDSAFTSVFDFHFCEPYYNYLCNAISIKFESGKISNDERDNLLTKCENDMSRLYGKTACDSLLAKLKPIVNARKIRPVVIARTEQLCELFEKEFGHSVLDYIHYDKQADLKQIRERIAALKQKCSSAFFLIPELFYHAPGKGLPRILYDMNCLEGRDFFIYSAPFTLVGFRGYYEDVYNNAIYSESELNITINGGGCFVNIDTEKVRNTKIIIEKNACMLLDKASRGHDGIIQVATCAQLYIGERSSFGDAHIAAHTFSKMRIGKDCLFSWGEMVFCSDGHAIFEILDSEKHAVRTNPNENDELIIGDHVWLGYRCHIVSGANIGDGCIVGAGSLVNKKFPNNCIIAGVPARIIKRNRAWSANPFYHDLEQDKLVYENYARLTDGE